MTADRNPSDRPGSTRRQFLVGGAVAGVGAAAAIGIDLALTSGTDAPAPAASGSTPQDGAEIVPFYGAHQAGIDTAAQTYGTFVALDLLPEVQREAQRRMMKVLTDDAARLTRGEPALADSEPELAVARARLTVTFGFGPEFVARAGGAGPAWLKPLPAFSIDRLEPAYTGGDLLIQIAADDPLVVAHATRMLLKDSRSFTTVRWVQRGFRRSAGAYPERSMRNLFGQVDGTVNPVAGTPDFDAVVWSSEGWLAGGTGMVVRRIRMTLDTWDKLDRSAREQSVGRTLSNGAPLTGTLETDDPDFEARNALGFPVIPEFSHIRRAHSGNPTERILRRPYNYDDAPPEGALSDSGLIFVAFQADIDAQFVPMQQRLADLDLLNEWTVPIGSAVFAVPPGCAEGGFVGETLLA
ncbi:Dyp-type peroxidase [Microbacterium sp. bgisy207]|uniref:Dyp-type peroxidase n=1 Tax=Microbacterium sp. bgisy207 TaxID=3413800 RepID=UPI003EBF3A74